MPANDPVFVDTSGWIALLNKDDALHVHATNWLAQFRSTQRSLITTDWVLAETGNGLARTAARSGFAGAVQTFLQSPHGKLIQVDALIFQQALALYHQAADKTWGAN